MVSRCVQRLRLSVAAALLLFSSLASAIDVDRLPKPTGYVSDLAHVASPEEKQTLEEFCTRVEQELGVQFALVTIDTLDDQPIRDVALEIARKWGVGSKKDNQGVLLLLAIKDHKDDIETGRGIEPYITDGFAGSTLRTMRPYLRNGDYGVALLTAAHSMAAQIAQGKGTTFTMPAPQTEEPRRQSEDPRSGGGIPVGLIIFGVLFLILLLGRGGRRGGGGYGGGGGGFLTGMLLGNLLSGGRRDGGGWGGGGGFGGDSGGGGFGGFGGGDFGGGGASSDW